ncbi:MAG: hypothetical protein ABIJ36_00405 [Patescibacteria group bacterium]
MNKTTLFATIPYRNGETYNQKEGLLKMIIDIRNLLKQVKRAWRIFVRPPKESRKFAVLDTLPVVFKRVASCSTEKQPKQVAVSETHNLAFVSCMEGKCVQVFGLKDLRLADTLNFDDQCVEVVVDGDLLFVTTTNFGRAVRKNMLYIVDIPTLSIVGSVNPEGNWSKVIAIAPSKDIALVSNWHTHDISVVDIKDISNPRLLQRVPCGESPRGLTFVNDNKVLAACFYSGTIVELTRQEGGEFAISHKTLPFEFPKYGGNLRDIALDPHNKDIAWVSNLGRNMVHRYSISRKRIEGSVMVGKEPNSIRFLKGRNNTLLVSCRASNTIVVLDTEKQTIVGKSFPTGSMPTGLETFQGGFLTTGFEGNTLEMYRPI